MKTLQYTKSLMFIEKTFFFMKGHLTKDDTVLIHAGGSGVGTAAVQLIKQSGAKCIITAGSQEKIDFVKTLGAAAGINYKEEAVGERVLELTNGESSFQALKSSACNCPTDFQLFTKKLLYIWKILAIDLSIDL